MERSNGGLSWDELRGGMENRQTGSSLELLGPWRYIGERDGAWEFLTGEKKPTAPPTPTVWNILFLSMAP